MSDEPTKACVRVLKLESAWISLLKFIVITIPFKIGHAAFEVMKFFMTFINMCIVRSIMRWVGFPIAAYLMYLFILTNVKTDFALCMGYFAASVTIGFVAFFCWAEIPYKEQKILFKYEG